jgi:NTE family protein
MTNAARQEESLARAASPVDVGSQELLEVPAAGVALCLSGGGYRAMLFHIGALWRLNTLRYLPKLDRVSSVSGGSITAGILAMNWDSLGFDDSGIAQRFQAAIVEPVLSLASRTVDVPAILGGALGPRSIGERLASAYRRYLFAEKTLQDTPERPRFVFNATNLQSGVLWRFSKPYLRDYRVGEVRSPAVELAAVVAASSAFPPFLSPTVLHLNKSNFTPGSGSDLQRPPFTSMAILSDGGVYDNLGLETAWKRYSTILVSDGGGQMQPVEKPKRNWLSQSYRVLNVIDNQVRSLRKRQTINSFRAGVRSGTYWGIRSHVRDYGLADALPCPREATILLADLPTRLKAMPALLQERLINWGFAVCDAAMRRHVDPAAAHPEAFPYPHSGI